MNKVEIIYTVVYHTMVLQWKLYNGAGEAHKFRHVPGTVFPKLCLLSLSWKTTYRVGPQNFGGRFIQVSLYIQRDNDKRMYSSDYKLINDTL